MCLSNPCAGWRARFRRGCQRPTCICGTSSAHLLGLDDDLLVRDIDDATDLVDTIRRRQFVASPEGQEITVALMALIDELTPGHGFDKTIPPLIRHLISDKYADLLDVPKSNCTKTSGRSPARQLVVCALLGQVLPELPRFQLVSVLARPFGRELMQACSIISGVGCERRSTYPTTWPASGRLSNWQHDPGRLAQAKDIDDVLRNVGQIIDWAATSTAPSATSPLSTSASP